MESKITAFLQVFFDRELWSKVPKEALLLLLLLGLHTGPDQVKIVQKLYVALNPNIMVQITIKTYFYEIPDAIANFMQPLK